MSPALVGQVPVESEAAFPTDWSHHHLIFSKPATAEQAKRVQQDPRYWQQMARQSPATLREAETGSALVPELQLRSKAVLRERAKIKKDWSADLGSGASVGARNYPAKYSFKGTTANCDGSSQPDFVVYGTGVAGSSGQASILAVSYTHLDVYKRQAVRSFTRLSRNLFSRGSRRKQWGKWKS